MIGRNSRTCDGVTKISKLEMQNKSLTIAENFEINSSYIKRYKFLLVKLADNFIISMILLMT